MYFFTSPPYVVILLVAMASATNALRLPIEAVPLGHLARRAAPTNSSIPVATFQNLQYFVNITVGGQVYTTAIDTGSADMWIYANVSNTTTTTGSASLSYAIGNVEGNIVQAPLSFAGYNVPSQAFSMCNHAGVGHPLLNADKYARKLVEVQNVTGFTTNPRNEGYTALVGLGPPESSTVYSAFNTTVGLPMMNNIFRQNLTNENYITLLLPRAFDPDSNSTGVMTVSELVPGFEAVANQTKLPVSMLTAQEFTQQQQHWTTLTDANGVIGPNGQAINVMTNVTSAAGTGKLVAVFDSGYSLPQVPKAISDALYSGLPGAQLINVTGAGEIWEVPCTQEVNVTFVFGGQKIFVHPLDVTLPANASVATNSSSICYGAFQPIGANAASPYYDMILGMGFLRNAHILLDYGTFSMNTSTDQNDPFIQLLAITNATEAHNDFVNVRINNNGTVPMSKPSTTSAATPSFSPNPVYWSSVLVGLAVTILCL
ncbi:hypothetical protein FRB96_007624 [Tulasnella sp. 330]|nr:hypothetical protein FRB96_007624 [Tulasnella sp. 330]